MEKRPFDVILYGATGFTGRQTVRYFQQYAPPGVRWAVAGRNRGKLQGRTRAGQTGEVLLRCAGDPANRVTVLCVCESALALVCNLGELPARAGVLTPSTGIGDALITRLRNREFTFQVLR